MKIHETELPGILIVEPDRFGDSRGFFQEVWHQRRYAEAGMPETFVQDNMSLSSHGVLRGLHFQEPNAQGKLVYVLQGEVFDVAVDIRVGSPTFGKWVAQELSADNALQIYIPPGFAHGFCVTGNNALLAYKCTEFYRPEAEGTVRWDDPKIGIKWPINNPTVSAKDADAPALGEIESAGLPVYGESE